MNYRAFYKLYDDGGLTGYYSRTIWASSHEEAEAILFSYLNERVLRGRIEYTICKDEPIYIYNSKTREKE
jgi:hypothetical protein